MKKNITANCPACGNTTTQAATKNGYECVSCGRQNTRSEIQDHAKRIGAKVR